MSTVFVGGSRHISRLSSPARDRLDNVMANGFAVVVGDASGADKAVQKYLVNAAYKNVTVYCSGDTCRNNLGNWHERHVPNAKNAKGFHLYALKDREMARQADFGLMIWDGKSPGTALNVLRLIRAGKKAVLLNVPADDDLPFKSFRDWERFIKTCNASFLRSLKERATPDEWGLAQQPPEASLFDETAPAQTLEEGKLSSEEAALLEKDINAALAIGDPRLVVDALGTIAKAKGMSQVAKDAGLARESLYRSLSTDGNPEFATVMKVLTSVGLRLSVSRARL